MSAKKRSFLVYYDNQAPEMLDDAQLGRLWRMMLAFDEHGEEPAQIDDANLKACWLWTRAQLRRDAEKYREKCKKAKESADKRWREAKAQEGMQTHTDECERMGTYANDADIDTDTDIDIDTENETEERGARFARPARERPTLDEVEAFFDANDWGGYGNSDAFFDFYEERGWTDGKGEPIRDWQALASRWIDRANQ